MEIIRETAYFGRTRGNENDDVGMAVLENGVWLLHHPDGSATGSDGRTYYRVWQKIRVEVEPEPYFNLPFLPPRNTEETAKPHYEIKRVPAGWTTDPDAPVVLPMEEK